MLLLLPSLVLLSLYLQLVPYDFLLVAVNIAEARTSSASLVKQLCTNKDSVFKLKLICSRMSVAAQITKRHTTTRSVAILFSFSADAIFVSQSALKPYALFCVTTLSMEEPTVSRLLEPCLVCNSCRHVFALEFLSDSTKFPVPA